MASALGLGIAYAGTANADVADILKPIFEEANVSMELVALAGIYVSFPICFGFFFCLNFLNFFFFQRIGFGVGVSWNR